MEPRHTHLLCTEARLPEELSTPQPRVEVLKQHIPSQIQPDSQPKTQPVPRSRQQPEPHSTHPPMPIVPSSSLEKQNCLKKHTQPSFNQSDEDVFFTEQQLASRWQISIKKLQADRWKAKGAPYVKLGSLVRYRLADIRQFESTNAQHKDTP